MKKLPVFILLTLLSAGSFAQNDGEITGKVIDLETQKPIEFAYLTLYANSIIVMQAMTDEFGLYTLKPLQPGAYDLQIIGFGYDTAMFYGIEVATRGLTVQVFEIQAGIELGGITITAPLIDKQDPTVVSTFKAEDFGHMAVDNPIDVAVTSKQVQQNEQTGGLYIAGSREDATLYIVDGVKVIGSLYLPMKAIKEINVITGGIPANYGDVTGGIVEITTKSYTGFF